MPDNQADILGQLAGKINEMYTDNYSDSDYKAGQYNRDQTVLLASIDQTLRQIAQNGSSMSASNARNALGDTGDIRNVFRSRNSGFGIGGSRSGSSGGFLDGVEDALMEAVLGSGYKDRLRDIMNQFADDIGVPLKDVPQELGKEIGNKLINQFKGTKIGKDVFGKVESLRDGAIERAKEAYTQGRDKYTRTPNGQSVSSKVSDLAQKGVEAGTEAAGAGAALGGITEAAAAFAPELLAAMAALVALEIITDKLAKAFEPAVEGLKSFGTQLKASWNRENASREKYVKLASERLEADVKTMIETPFTILEDAANRVYDAWDKNIQLVNQTQGYTKADLQNLISSFSERIRSEGLEKVISSTSIVESLANVLNSGLSGKIAEEFAYRAAVLNASIPTQDFYNFASTYASIAANAVKNGKSQNEAISIANKQLDAFASNLLYSSRQLAGGFSTGLKNAQDLFEKSVQISQAARTGDSSQISGVLTSVSAIVGAIAPDLASGIVDTVYQAAVGGNRNTSLVALRSLAGINASNTEFLKQLATNPQQVFSSLFQGLAKMQNMSSAYMETSEALADIFGVSMDAFARVDFNYLAQAVSQMNTNNASLSENIALLASGESTTTAEQMRIQKINEYMIDQGLAYVLDNEAARAIQQHMWDEQLAQQLTEAEYAVNLQGSALEALQGIHHTIDNILSFLNPLAWGKRLGNLVATAAETKAQGADIRQLLELGKVGNGNAQDLYRLTTRGVQHNITQSLISMFGGTSMYSSVEGLRQIYNTASNMLLGTARDYNMVNSAKNGLLALASGAAAYQGTGVNSLYKWGTIGKSTAAALLSTAGGHAYKSTAAAQVAATAATNANLERMLGTIEDFAGQKNKQGFYYSYEDWADTAKKYGISDLGKALQDSGYTEQQVQEYFQDASTRAAAWEEAARRIKEEQAWDATIEELPMIDELTVKSNELLDINNQYLDSIFNAVDDFHKKWVEYVYNHEIYSSAYTYSDVEKIAKQVKSSESDTAIQTLANILTKNTTDLTDPQVQSNALLAEILKTVLVIMNQNNQKTDSNQLKDSINALALGFTG